MKDENAETVSAPMDAPPAEAPASHEKAETAGAEENGAGVTIDQIGAPIPEGYTDAVFAEMADAFPVEAGALRRGWGDDVAVNTAFARRALEQIETAAPGFVAEMSGQVAVASPKILAALSALGRSLAATPGDPDSVRLDRAMVETISAAPASEHKQDQDLQGEIDRITAQAWKDGAYYSNAVQDELRPLYQQLHGTAQISGRQP